MKPDSLFQEYYARLRREGILKSLLWGAAIGALAAFAVGFAGWLAGFGGFFLTVGVFAAVTAGVALAAYFLFFRPNARAVARRVDALGLEERLITMLELKDSDDYIARRQREDAEAALEKFGLGRLGFALSMTLTVLLCVGGAFGLGMTAVNGLTDLGVIPSGAQLIAEAQGRNPANYIDVEYTAMTGGVIFGEAQQNIRKETGETQTVIAVPDDGYRFYRWTDGYPYPVRSDTGLTEDITFTAWFLPLDDDGAEEVPDGDEALDQPPEDGNAQEPSESQPSEGVNPENYDYVIDWTIKYRDLFDEYYEEAMEALAQDPDLTEEEKQFLETYFNALR